MIVFPAATNINPLVNLGEYLTMHILPELEATSINDRPIVKAACIKFIATFRAQFTAEHLTALLPMLIPFTGSSNFVVHTYAATAIERLLLVRDRIVDGTYLYSAQAFCSEAIFNLFACRRPCYLHAAAGHWLGGRAPSTLVYSFVRIDDKSLLCRK
jgi:hypothetical protein